jgi:putative oxidoreductase
MDALGNRPLERYALSLLRIVAGFTFTFHGWQKLFGLFGGMGGHGAQAPMMSLPWFAGILELFGGLLIILGLFTRPVAFILAGEMAFAYFLVHAPRAFWPIVNMGELAVLYCFIFLYLAAVGAGSVSLDWMIGRRRRKDSKLI